MSHGFSGKKAFYNFAFLVEDTASFVIVKQDASVTQRHKQRGVKRLAERRISDVDIRIRGERAWFGPAVGVDMEKPTACGDTASGAFLITREGDVDHLRMLLAQSYDFSGQIVSLLIPRCQFLTFICDRNKVHKDHSLAAAIRKVLDNAAASGHVCLPKNELLEQMVRFTGCSRDCCIEAIRAAFRDGRLLGANSCLYSPKRYEQEESISSNLVRLMAAECKPVRNLDRLISDCEIDLYSFAESQKDAIRNVFQNPVSVITGGPGVGKTTVTKGILAVHKDIYGSASKPVLLAPTGKAARRLSEATGYPAQTIHSAVGWKGEEFDYDAQPVPLDGNLIIIDECSMMDQQIAAILFERIETGSRLVLIGDVDQLPSVGCGNVLRDIIDSKVVPTARLTEIFRQAGENPIITNAHKINQGDDSLVFGKQFRFVECLNEQEIFEAACRMYVRCVSAYGDEEVVLLNPQRNNTLVSVDRFNAELQARINPPAPGKMEIRIGKTVFREGDKVMELKNTEAGPKNGDIGYIREISRRKSPEDPDQFNYYANIEWNGDRTWIEYNQDDMRHVTLAFCTTVHKAQGSEYKYVIEVVSRAHPGLLKKNLIYTGITRSREAVCLIGELESLSRAIKRNRDDEDRRYTLLASRLKTEMDGIFKQNITGKEQNNAKI